MKLENLLARTEGLPQAVTGGAHALHVRLIDFGSALDPHSLRSLYGESGPSAEEQTMEYAPPEALLGRWVLHADTCGDASLPRPRLIDSANLWCASAMTKLRGRVKFCSRALIAGKVQAWPGVMPAALQSILHNMSRTCQNASQSWP